MLNSGKSQDFSLAAMTRNIMTETAKYGIDLHVIHILGVSNKITDLLSRQKITQEPEKNLEKF